ncbi:Centromere/kinetochore protein zw10, partial [Coemansia erecta]
NAISLLLEGVDELQLMLGDEESGIQTRLDTAIQNETQIRERLQSNSAILQCLKQLSGINGELQEMDRLVQHGELAEAAQKAEAVETAVNAVDEIEGTQIKSVLEERVSLARMNITENVQRELRKIISIDSDAGSVRIRAELPQREERVSALFVALDSVKDGDKACQELASYIIGAFVRPMLAARTIVREDTESDSAEFCVQLDNGDGMTPAADICNIVQSLVAYVGRVVSDRVWTDSTLVELAQLVLHRCYLQRIPETRVELAEFYTVADTLADFETALLAQCADPSIERPIQAAVKRLDELFVEQQCARALEQSRRAAESTTFAIYELNTHQEWSLSFLRAAVEDENTDTVLAPSLAQAVEELPPMVFPQCVISESIAKTTVSAYCLVNEAMQCSDTGLARLLVETAQSVLSMYCMLFPAVHRQQLRKVPALAWQFFNDCMYGAHHSAILGQLVVAGNLTDSGWQGLARKFFDTGIRHAGEMAEAESRELKSLVGFGDDNALFYNASDEQQQLELEKTLNRGRLALAQLCTAMQPPSVTPHMFYRTLGRYLDAVFATIIDGIIGVRDIGVDDSQVLSDHCRAAHRLVSMFHIDAETLGAYSTPALAAFAQFAGEQGEGDTLLDSDDDSDNESDTAARGARLAKKYCHLADKLVQLADILAISRADILARRRAGLLGQFSVDELVSLIRALFSDTHERAVDIDELKRI